MREEKHTDMSLTDEQASLLGFKSLSMPEQYIQVKDVRYTLDEFNRIGEFLLGRNLSDDQQVVLEWFKNEKKDQPFATVADFVAAYFEGAESEVPLKTMVAFEFLTNKQQFQVLAAFAEWGLAND